MRLINNLCFEVRDNPFGTYPKLTEKLTFLTPLICSHKYCVSWGQRLQFFGKFCKLTKWMIPGLNKLIKLINRQCSKVLQIVSLCTCRWYIDINIPMIMKFSQLTKTCVREKLSLKKICKLLEVFYRYSGKTFFQHHTL